MSPTPRPDPRAILQAAAADLPENQPAALADVQALFPELTVEAAIGRGGSGVVYRVRQTKLGRFAALKLLDPALAARDPTFAERLRREGQALAQLDHPGILRVHDFGERAGRFYLLTEFVDGIDLRKLIAMGELAPEEAMRIVPPLCAALQYAHDRGVVHRDVKPENVLIDVDGHVKLADFGLARLLGEASDGPQLTRQSQVMGTPHYMAPEQFRAANVDHRADIFALGVVLYELLTGQVPAGDFAPPSQRRGVPRSLDAIVRRALAQDPARRYQRAEELGSDVRAQAGGPAGAVPMAAWAPPGVVPQAAVVARNGAERRPIHGLLVGSSVLQLVTSAVLVAVRVVYARRHNARVLEFQLAQSAAREAGLPAPLFDRSPILDPGLEAGLWIVLPLLGLVGVVLGHVAVSRIRAGGPPFAWLPAALLLAWFSPMLAVEVFVAFECVARSDADNVHLVAIPIALAFLWWRYRAAVLPPLWERVRR